MAEEQGDTELVWVDRLSKIAALGFAMGVFALASLLTPNVQFNMSVAAVGGIGIRLYVPYHASISSYGPDTVPSQAHPETGNYNHGAAGGALLIGSLAAIGVMAAVSDFFGALAAGIGIAVATYLVLRSILPSGSE